MEENGGGKVYGEYNKGPIKVGAEHNWDEDANDENVGFLKNWQTYYKTGVNNIDEEDSNVGGGRVYGNTTRPYKQS